MNTYKGLYIESLKLNETMLDVYSRYWMDMSEKIIPVEYHESYAREKFPQTKVMNVEDLYQYMFNQKYVRIVIEGERVWFEYSRANFIPVLPDNQLRELKNFAIENSKVLYDATRNKQLELN